MYINASQQERDLSISAIYNETQLISTINRIASEILEGIMTHILSTDDDLERIHMDLNLVFNTNDDSQEMNAVRLNFLIHNTKDVLRKINNGKKLDITGYDSPSYELTISSTVPNSKISLTAYSNLEDNMLWDEMIEWIE